MLRSDYPKAAPGQTIGLLGGSFDPAHGGHVHITHEALKRFGLDRVWWLVSPGNPLKDRAPADLARRVAAAQGLVTDPHVAVTDIEARLGTRYTADTVAALCRIYPATRFVWLMGADNLVQFHQWRDWEAIAAMVPIGVIARPGQGIGARFSRAARRLWVHRLPEAASHLLGRAAPPAWCFVNAPLRPESSTLLREGAD